ncbi:MAG: Gfo/Idh/MocA family oxidoreductase [Chthonomonadales bacterium]|nr:Gfo/Idh/MocA family oxidoreductase [Chthonomonadales bacterium]
MTAVTRWVVVGYGMGWHHARFIEATEGLELRGVCDVAPERLQKALGEHPAIKPYSNYDDVLADPDVDGVVIVTPHNTHAELAIRGMNAGKHTITDKAMCLSVAEAEQMIAARDRAGVLLSVFHNRRWDGDFLTVRQVLAEFQLGRLFHLQSCVTDWGKPGGWRRDRAAMGGWMFDWGAHTVDQILLLAGAKPVSVYAFCHYRFDDRSSVEDYINCTITFDSGFTATTVIGYLNMIPMPRWYAIGEYGALQVDGFETPARVRKLWEGAPKETEIPLAPSNWGAYYANIAAYLAGREELEVRAEQLVPQIAIGEAAYRSIETGQAVRLA